VSPPQVSFPPFDNRGNEKGTFVKSNLFEVRQVDNWKSNSRKRRKYVEGTRQSGGHDQATHGGGKAQIGKGKGWKRTTSAEDQDLLMTPLRGGFSFFLTNSHNTWMTHNEQEATCWDSFSFLAQNFYFSLSRNREIKFDHVVAVRSSAASAVILLQIHKRNET